jgi:putative phage-type endonuclease
MKVITAIQGSDEWRKARCGRITASRISDVMAKLKSGKPAAGRKNYVSELVAEKLSGEPQDNGYTNAAMQWGIDTEPIARKAYEKERFAEVEQVGMVIHPKMDFAAASPDGIVGDGLLEIKCPNTSTHIDTLLSGKVDRKYILQMQWQLCCTGKDWCDFMSYDPRLPGHEIWIKRIERDDDLIAEIESEVQSAYDEVTEIIAKLEAL